MYNNSISVPLLAAMSATAVEGLLGAHRIPTDVEERVLLKEFAILGVMYRTMHYVENTGAPLTMYEYDYRGVKYLNVECALQVVQCFRFFRNLSSPYVFEGEEFPMFGPNYHRSSPTNWNKYVVTVLSGNHDAYLVPETPLEIYTELFHLVNQ